MEDGQPYRALTSQEARLASWLLAHGNPDALGYVGQLERAQVTAWKCPCGCASINFKVENRPEAPPGVHTLADFQFVHEGNLCGVFIYSSDGILSGMEVWGISGDAPPVLPEPENLSPLESTEL